MLRSADDGELREETLAPSRQERDDLAFEPETALPRPPLPRNERAHQLLYEVFGHREFRGDQEEIITRVSAGEDAVVLMPTGGGKSLCYQLPALLGEGLTLVVSPLIALMKDQQDKLNQLGIDVLRLDSTLTPRDEVAAQLGGRFPALQSAGAVTATVRRCRPRDLRAASPF